MSLFTLVRSRCVKGMNLDVPRTRNMGSVIVFTRGLLLTGFCLVTAVSNTMGGKQQDSLPEFPFTDTHTHTEQRKSSLMAACLEKECIWKLTLPKYSLGHGAGTLEEYSLGFSLYLQYGDGTQRQTGNVIRNRFIYFLFTIFISFLLLQKSLEMDDLHFTHYIFPPVTMSLWHHAHRFRRPGAVVIWGGGGYLLKGRGQSWVTATPHQ